MNHSIKYLSTEVGELRALPVGRGQIGRVKYLAVGRGKVGRGKDIPQSVIKTGVKLPQLQLAATSLTGGQNEDYEKVRPIVVLI